MTFKLDKRDKIFIAVVLAVHVIFFLLACHYTRIYMGDSFEYIYEALNIKDLFFFYSGSPVLPITPEYMTQREPLYPLFLMGIYMFTVNNWIVIALQNALSIFNICYARSILLKIGFNKTYDWLLLLFLVAYPAQFINANTIAPDILLQTFTLLYFGDFISLFRTGHIRYAAYMSVALIAGFLVKPVLYPFVVIHAVIVFVTCYRQNLKMQRPLTIAVAPLIAALLFCYWNFTRTDKFHFSSNQAQNAVYYYYAYLAQKEGTDSAERFLKKENEVIAALPDFKARYEYANERGMDLVKQHFPGYLWFHLKNSGRILIEPGKAEMDLYTGALTYGRLYSKEQSGFYATLKTKGWQGIGGYINSNSSFSFIVMILFFNLLRLAGMALFFLRSGLNPFIRLFIFILIAYFSLLSGPIANTRYFLPVSLIAIGCAAIGYISILQKRLPII
jgi:hypothetical protein